MAETVLNPETQKPELKTKTIDPQNPNTRLKKILGIILLVVMFAMAVYIIIQSKENYTTLSQTTKLSDVSSVHQAANYRSYVTQYKDTKQQLEETTHKLELVKSELDKTAAELAAVKGMLSDTQTMLSQTQSENLKLRQELEGFSTPENVRNMPDLEAKINALKAKNAEVASELSSVNNELRAFQGDFSNLEEGRSLLELFRSKIALVKSRMRYLKQEAYFARVASQKEKDRIASLNGNNGFLTKGGQPQKPANGKNFAIDVKVLQ